MPAAEPIQQSIPQAANSIDAGTPEVDAGGFLKVFRWAGDLANDGATPNDLAKHLVVEDEVIRIILKVQRLQQRP